jgi:hypothetical protein
MKFSNRLVVMLGAVLAIVLVGGATWAMAQNSLQIAACVEIKDQKGKVSRLGYEENVSCDPDKETKIIWSVTGPQDPKGDTGPQGPKGEPGDAVKADPPCFDNANRYVDCGNGTATDTVTGLIWLKNANCFGLTDYTIANNAAAGLKDGDCGLTDNSSPGDWRLPTQAEWEATIERAVDLGCTNPSLTDTAGTVCGSGPFIGVQSYYYWSSTTFAFYPGFAWYVPLFDGFVICDAEPNLSYVWPVRGGQ